MHDYYSYSMEELAKESKIPVFAKSSSEEVFRLMADIMADTIVEHNKEGKNEGNANIGGSTPTGDDVLRAIIISLKGEVDFSSILAWPGISIYGEADWIGLASFNKENKEYKDYMSDLQLSLGVSLAI